VAAGAVVTDSVPPNSLVIGNPATVRETLPFGNR
jgi:acetyltransferase-like isoleucine patch superfamily enzyme